MTDTPTSLTKAEEGRQLWDANSRGYDILLHHRKAFARAIFSELICDSTLEVMDHAALHRRDYDRRKHQLEERLREIDAPKDVLALCQQTDEAAYADSGESFMHGIVFGHVVDEFRQSLLRMYPMANS